MKTAIFNPGLLALSPHVPLLATPWRLADDPVREVSQAFLDAKIPPNDTIFEVLPIASDLRHVSPEWNAQYYDSILCRHAERLRTAESVRTRLAAELDFYTSLYKPRSADNFKIYPVDGLRFSPDNQIFSTIVFVSNDEIFGCTDFDSRPDTLIVDYVQGLSNTSSAKQRETIGEVWFEALMRRILEAHSNLHDLGVRLMLRIEDENLKLPRMIRDRYFYRKPDASGKFYALNANRKRARELLD